MRTTQIYVLSLTSLKNDKHMAITAYMAEALRKFSIASTPLAVFVTAFMAAYEKENEAFRRIDRKPLAKNMKDADKERINALRVFRDELKTFEFRTDADKKALAQEILDIIDEYGGGLIYGQPIDARTANISNLIEDIVAFKSEAVETLGLTADFNVLKAANELFLQCQWKRDESDAAHGKKAMEDARKATDKAWRAIVEGVNSTITYGSEEDVEALVPFAKQMNVEIDKYRIQNGQGVGGGSNSSTNRPTDDEVTGGGSTETTPTMKNATFRKADGTAIVLPFEVGTVIVYPDNTVGYKWSPNLEFMPKTNKTFKEVPIVDRETIALFHFADHTEEEIKQYVGTILNAPQNTEGYRWSPAVPELMPAEDTQYYELPIENDDNQGGDQTGGGSTGGDNNGGSTGGGNNGNYPPGYDPDADLDPGV